MNRATKPTAQPARRALSQPAYRFFDHPAVQRVTAWALLLPAPKQAVGESLADYQARRRAGLPAGRILIAFPADGAGIVRAYVEIHAGPLAISREYVLPREWPGEGPETRRVMTVHSTQGTAGGYGYCKASAAVADACDRLGYGAAYDALSPLHGNGMSAVRSALETHGYQVVEVL